MVSKEEFKAFAKKRISGDDKKKFLKCKKRTKILLATILPIEILMAIFAVICVDSTVSKIIVGVFMGVVILVTCFTIPAISGFKWDNFKEKHIRAIMDYLLDGYTYSYEPDKYMDEKLFRKSFLFDIYDSYGGEDLFKITIKNDDGTDSNTQFLISDLDVTREETETVTRRDANGITYTEEETRTIDIFTGAFGYIKFPFQFKCTLAINDDEEDLEVIKLEDIQFNKNFIVSTDDQVEALCILTPTMMNKLKNLKKRTGQVGLLLCKDEMYIALDRNLFEMKSNLKELSVNVFDNLYDDISCMLGIAEEIKNNNKVFKMDNIPAGAQSETTEDTENADGDTTANNNSENKNKVAKKTQKRQSAKPLVRNENGELSDSEDDDLRDSSGEKLFYNLEDKYDEEAEPEPLSDEPDFVAEDDEVENDNSDESEEE